MSAFPLSAITLGNNIHAYLAPNDVGWESGSGSGSRREVMWYRCVASIPPVLGACLVRDLGMITKYTGITGFAIIFFYPVLLSYQSHHQLLARGLDPRTYYTCALTSDACKLLLAVFGVCMVLLTLFT